MRKASVLQDSLEVKENRKLKDALYLARRYIIQHVPLAFIKLLDDYRFVDVLERNEIWDLLDDVANTIIETTTSNTPIPTNILEDYRVYCPLCGDGTQSVIQEGFKLPEGLRRHLLGAHGSHQCFVMECALSLAVERFDEKRRGSERPNV